MRVNGFKFREWLVFVLLSVLCGCGSRSNDSRYSVTPITRGNIQQRVTASGSLSATISVDVGSQVSGKVTALYADFNSPVRKGQLVAEIDPTLYEAALRQAEGELASEEADVVLKRQNLKRKQVLVPLKAATQLDLDQATAELAQAEAAVVVKRAALASARANLGYCRISAPVDGIVIARKVDLGQTVIAAMNTPVLFTIAQDISHMRISAAVAEADIGRVREGQSVEFTVDAFPEEIFHGTVSQVRKTPTTTQNVVTYETLIAVDNPEQKLFPGMTADVEILVASHTNILKVPNAALRFAPPPGAEFAQAPPPKLSRDQRLLYAVESTGTRLQTLLVRTGLTDGVYTEVEGLPEGSSVVTATLSNSKSSQSAGFTPPPPPPDQ